MPRSCSLTLLVAAVLGAGSAQARDLSFADRISCQEAIERVYYTHQIGAMRPFEEALPRAVLEQKVATSLKQSLALEEIWRRPMTPEMLQREMERMASQTRMPGRLRELFTALGNDAFLVQECLARPALVNRLTRNFFAFDARFHSAASKRSWDEWWPRASHAFDPATVEPVALAGFPLPVVGSQTDEGRTWSDVSSEQRVASASPSSCLPDDTWDNGSLDDVPEARQYASAVWTGSLMVIWGGAGNSGGRYDPATDTWSPTSRTGAPAARSEHQAVWTGSLMIVWGGGFNTGGRYDPVADVWTPTSTVLAPDPRSKFTAVWTGREMIVWGGINVGYLNTGGRYDPATDRWNPLPLTGAPIGVAYHTAVWTGQEMLVWGGYAGNFNTFGSGGRYDPATNQWTWMSPIGQPSSRLQHTAVWTGNEMIIWGGNGLFGSNFATGGRYDPATNSWRLTSTTNAPSARREHTAVWTGNAMLVWGGGSDSTGGRYDPVADAWTATSLTGAPAPRSRHTAVWTGSEMVVWGGSGSGNGGLLDTGGRYNPATDAWIPTDRGQAPSAGGYTAVWTGNWMIVWRGGDKSGSRYDPITDSWTPTATTDAFEARTYHTAVWTGQEMIVWGGEKWVDIFSVGVDTGGRYDPMTDTWRPTSTTNAPSGRFDHSAIWTGASMVIWGGTNSRTGVVPLGTGASYDPISDTWTATSTTAAPGVRYGHTAVWTGSEMIVWGGGVDSGGRYDPASDTWRPVSTIGAPTPRRFNSAVWAGDSMLIWGGTQPGPCCSYLNTGGRYNPIADSWSPITTTSAPAARNGHTTIWTGREMVVWGGSGGEALISGGRYDPATDSWVPTSLTGTPPPLSGHVAVWTGSAMIVWGGGVRSGGRYVLGQGMDDDGDGFSECAGDCNDANPAMHPAAVELCDGADNDCDGAADNAPPLSAIPFLTVELSGESNVLTWSPVSEATGFDVVYGALQALVDSGGDFTVATVACVVNDLAETASAIGPAEPALGDGFWYLVRPSNCGGSGTYDSGGPGQARPRDAGIAGSAAACP